jgi:archaemetzincin
MKSVVFLQKIGDVDSSILIRLKKNLYWLVKEYAIKVKILPNPIIIRDDEYIEVERQYDGELILTRLEKTLINPQKNKLLGIIDGDIKGIRKVHLFGLTSLKNSCALISINRLRGSFYRKYEDNALFELRILKEAVHELGHTFGLKHCKNECVMKYSKSLEEVDKRPKEFCFTCEQVLKRIFKT